MLACLAAVIFAVAVSPANAETDYTAIAKASLNEAIRPGYAALAETTSALNAKVAALCKEPSAAALKDAKGAFAGVEQGRDLPLRPDRR